jgi:hypothetical protein
MNMIRPSVFMLAAAVRRALEIPFTQIDVTVPRGAPFRLDYILVSYPVTVVAGAQTSPSLHFELYDSRGLASNNVPIRFRDITTPSQNVGVIAAQGFRIEYPPGAVISMRVTNMLAGPVPATISVTYLSQKGWGVR